LQIELEAIYHLNPDVIPSSVTPQVFIFALVHRNFVGVPWRHPHRRSGLATLPSVGAVP